MKKTKKQAVPATDGVAQVAPASKEQAIDAVKARKAIREDEEKREAEASNGFAELMARTRCSFEVIMILRNGQPNESRLLFKAKP